MLHPLIEHGAQGFCIACSVRCVSLLPRSSGLPLNVGTTVRHSTSIPESATSSDRDKEVLWASDRGNRDPEESQEGKHESGTEQEAEPSQYPPQNSTNVDGEDLKVSLEDQVLSLHQDVLEGLQHRQPHKLLNAFLKASQNPHYLRALPATTFKEVLRSLDPKNFLDPYKTVHGDLGEDSPYISYQT